MARDGASVVLTWAGASNVKLQQTTTLAPANWQDVAGTQGASSYTNTAPSGTAFYRLLRP